MFDFPRSRAVLSGKTLFSRRAFRVVLGVWLGAVVLAVAGVPAARGAEAVTVYVDAGSGSDARSFVEAQSSSTPWQSIDLAVGLVPAGSTIVALSGDFSLNAVGVSFDPAVVIKGESGTSIVARIEGSKGLTLSGFFYPEYTNIGNSSSIVLKDGESVGGIGIGSNSSYVTLSGMFIHNVDDPDVVPFEKAVSLGGSSGQVTNITIFGNRFSENAEDSIQINWAKNVVIESNQIINNGPWNATVQRDQPRHSDVVQILGGDNISILNNTVVGNENVLMLKPHFGRQIGTIVVRGNYFEGNAGFALNVRSVPGQITLESNTYVCNGTAFQETCGDPNQYAVSAKDTPSLERINDPASEGQSLTTASTVPTPTTTNATTQASTTTTDATATTDASTTTADTGSVAAALAGGRSGPGDGAFAFRWDAATFLVVASVAMTILYMLRVRSLRRRKT